MTFVWVLLAAVSLYVLKTLYDVNVTKRRQNALAIQRVSRKKERILPTIDINVPPELPPGVTPEESFRQADAYDLGEKGSEKASESEEEAPLLVVKDLIPETENIDLDCFVYFKGARLLVVEDNILNQKIIKTVLKHSGIEIDIAENGEVALEYLFKQKNRYDMVLMDISMPIMDGIAATKIIRRASRFKTLPIVTFTAFGLGPEIEAMFKAGANAYLIKPLNVAQLYTVFMLFIGNVNRGLSLNKMFEIQGLDTEKGLENAEGDPLFYKERLRHFVHRYASSATLVPKWIDEERYERLKIEFRELLRALEQIGAYDMHEMAQEMQLHLLYRNEHLLEREKLLFHTKMQALMDTINIYLDVSKKTGDHRL